MKDQLEYQTEALIYAWDNLLAITQQPVMPSLISVGTSRAFLFLFLKLFLEFMKYFHFFNFIFLKILVKADWTLFPPSPSQGILNFCSGKMAMEFVPEQAGKVVIPGFGDGERDLRTPAFAFALPLEVKKNLPGFLEI